MVTKWAVMKVTYRSPTRIDADLFDTAKVVGQVMSRSAAQQINHWARIGRELEAAGGTRHREIAQVLAGQASYDVLSAREQAIVRAEWDERIAATRDGLDLASGFLKAGVSWVEADETGAPVVRNAR